jgi:SUKH-3 immunity protein
MFKKEVQNLFKKAGWFEGRNIKPTLDKIKGFEKFPPFLQSFLYEYGDLKVETHKFDKNDVTAILNFRALKDGYFKIEEYLKSPAYYGKQFTFPIAYYDLDNATLECDAEGRIYMSGDVPCLISDDFEKGIEKIIMEDYNDTLQWNPEINQWVDEY